MAKRSLSLASPATSSPEESIQQKNGWHWQLRHQITHLDALKKAVPLSAAEEQALAQRDRLGGLPLGITPHFLSLMDPNDPADPLRRQVIPFAVAPTEDPHALADPLGETAHEPVPHLIHRYPDRVLLLATDRCASYCRFCTRKRLVGQGPTPKKSELELALAYVRERPEIKEVILSGGDALILDDARLAHLLGAIRQIPSVEIIRLATRVMTFMPQRITPQLIEVLKAHQPVYVMSHFNHPNELDEVAAGAVQRLVDHGVPVLNQTVLLAGVNDDETTLIRLFRQLTRLRARPYYLHQCDLAPGTTHFRVPLAQARALFGGLRGKVSGIALPTFVVDIPGGHGKVPIFPDPIRDEDDDGVWLEGFDGGKARYPTDGLSMRRPAGSTSSND